MGSWSSAAEGANSAGSASSAASGASMAGSGSSLYGQMADVGGTQSMPATGFNMGTAGQSSGMGPTMDAANMQTYGTTNPSLLARGINAYEQFDKGGQQSLSEAWKTKAWDNPATYGKAYAMLSSLKGAAGGGGQPVQFNTNINAQQPQDTRYNDLYRRRY